MKPHMDNDRATGIKTFNTVLYCDQFDETVRFYRECLGFPVILEKTWFVEFAVSSGARLSVANRKRTSMESSKGKGITLTFQVERIAGIHERLSRLGLAPTAIVTHSWGAELFHVFDPEGHRLEFWSPLEAGS